MSRVLTIVFLLILVAAGIAYGVYWKTVHDRALALLDEQVAVWRAEGYEVTWEERTTGGFPLDVEAVFTLPSVTNRPGEEPWTWVGDRLRVHLRPWAWDTITIEPEGRHRATTREYGVIDADAESFSVTIQADAVGVVKLGLAGKRAALVDHDDGTTVAAAETLTALAVRDEADASLYHITGGIERPEWAGARSGAPDSISVDADVGALDRLLATGGADAATLAAWSAAGGGVGVRDLRIAWPDSEIGGDGILSLDDQGEWNGRVAIEGRSPGRAFSHLADLGAIDPTAAQRVGAVADAVATGDDQAARIAFELRSGEVYLLGLKLGELAPAY